MEQNNNKHISKNDEYKQKRAIKNIFYSAVGQVIMKIAILTMAYGTNYGNRLQNYALQELLRGIGLSTDTLHHKLEPTTTLCRKIIRFLKRCIKKVIRCNYEQAIRNRLFRKFDHEYVQWGKVSLSLNVAPAYLPDAYDYFIVGSDQVWNANFGDVRANINNFLATFVPPEKRISYAASFGTSQIAEGYEDLFKAELPKFKAISVREQEGVRLVEKCGAEATLVLDPTMMLNQTEWDKLASRPKFISDEPFIATYFLGGRSQKLDEYIKTVADGRRIVNLYAEFTPREKIEDIAAFTAPPDEFVWLIAHADCVLTDSFHGSVFSILYHRPFKVFERLINGKSGGMESRIDTLLGTFGLETCRGDINAPSGAPANCDWDKVETILAEKRKESMDFLLNALK